MLRTLLLAALVIQLGVNVDARASIAATTTSAVTRTAEEGSAMVAKSRLQHREQQAIVDLPPIQTEYIGPPRPIPATASKEKVEIVLVAPIGEA